jgi:hypothetical protein
MKQAQTPLRYLAAIAAALAVATLAAMPER